MTSEATIERPFLGCCGCGCRLTMGNYPVQSSSCGHSICKMCFKDTSQDGGYFDCPACEQPMAFHPKLSKPNFMAICAINMMKEYEEEIIRLRTGKNAALTSESNDKDEVHASMTRKDIHPLINAESPLGGTASLSTIGSDESSDEGTPGLASPPPPLDGERMVWVKFDKGTQLAFLLRYKDSETGVVRWESNKYEEEVALDRIEEMVDDGRRAKRCRRVSVGSYCRDSPGAHHGKKTKKRRKSLV